MNFKIFLFLLLILTGNFNQVQLDMFNKISPFVNSDAEVRVVDEFTYDYLITTPSAAVTYWNDKPMYIEIKNGYDDWFGYHLCHELIHYEFQTRDERIASKFGWALYRYIINL